ncbi:carbamoyltransferase HypF [Vibrio penaeicida]|uniref:carbamoyltransferase HypF n=1 Tax=Vibrio penaeicida TaxID=104609 RepID=UPI000CEA1DA4|nr:carbamoyltransferase HypF [Vibrio penaeicida]
MKGERLRVSGVVQGVGFRPTVWRIANNMRLNGQVFNDGEGVLIELWNSKASHDTFIAELHRQCPPLANIESIERIIIEQENGLVGFSISTSQSSANITAGVPADAATCEACAKEISAPSQRRYRYPFTNCTHCGPRFSIIKSMPYDRPLTSMAVFPLCEACHNEYMDPVDRRFHAQPVACPECGPSVWLCDQSGDSLVFESSDVIEELGKRIIEGQIAAVKGVGGFHLVCDATNNTVVETLRARKFRPAKPFAIMMSELNMVRHYCHITLESERLVKSSAAPIVLLPQKRSPSYERAGLKKISAHVAPNLNEIGVMLPNTPLHLMLMHHVERPLIMTSANISGNPQCTDNAQALSDLSDIADVWLMHDRDIVTRVDDSVARQTHLGVQLLRRARGYAPLPIQVPEGFENTDSVLAVGGQVKNTFCMLTSKGAVLSQYIGDLECHRVWQDFLFMIEHYKRLFQFSPTILAHDSHPEYIASKYANSLNENIASGLKPLNIVSVQHHHAHIVSCLAENRIPLQHPAVMGVVFDGIGYGDDGTLWGGEFIKADYVGYSRIAHLDTIPLIGGTQAITQPWRNLLAWLDRYSIDFTCINDWEAAASLNEQPLKTLRSMVANQLNCPQTSSAGRLFDAVAAALSLTPVSISYEGEAAMLLEACALQGESEDIAYPFEWRSDNNLIVSSEPMWRALIDDLYSGTSKADIAKRFHIGLAHAVLATVLKLCEQFDQTPCIVLTGGVFQNKLLLECTYTLLTTHRFTVLTHQNVPANDGGIALGQAFVAAAHKLRNG